MSQFDPQFGPLQVPQIGAADMGPSKQEQRRILAVNVTMNMVMGGPSGASLSLVAEGTTPEKRFVEVCTLIEKYIDSGNGGK